MRLSLDFLCVFVKAEFNDVPGCLQIIKGKMSIFHILKGNIPLCLLCTCVELCQSNPKKVTFSDLLFWAVQQFGNFHPCFYQ